MGHTLQCQHTYPDGEKASWRVRWEILDPSKDSCELLVHGRGSEYRIILGQCSTGRYLCIPLLDIGCGLAEPWDLRWNTAQIASVLNETDAVTIAAAIYDHSRHG
ncbi:hypothetical protein [Blautia sp. An81]|uniref:hypothetical protein n=1 Tax=Blautia sp. An81 TaxID=1965659 RepID=UPI000B3A7428|nr:hypothetical protein [Blautia sp. An81]OUN21335.1 hypothetical protein B5G33_20755 [Blautia sp. An81]